MFHLNSHSTIHHWQNCNFVIFVVFGFFMMNLQLLPVVQGESTTVTLESIWIRDPNIFLWNGTYYLTGTTVEDGFLGWNSTDLMNWNSMGYIYKKNTSNGWAQYNFWAPEVVVINGEFFMFFSGKTDSTRRGTGVAKAANPWGPYVDYGSDAITPRDRECLDGHLFRHPNGSQYLIYVYEWVQAGTGEMWIQPIDENYSKLEGSPAVLFKGTDASWGSDVVDGPAMLFINNTYYLFWSSFNTAKDGTYCCGYASSDQLLGPYIQSPHPVIQNDSGHCTIFQNTTNSLKIVAHRPNGNSKERAYIWDLLWDPSDKQWEIRPADPIEGMNWAIVGLLIVAALGVISLYCSNNRLNKSKILRKN